MNYNYSYLYYGIVYTTHYIEHFTHVLIWCVCEATFIFMSYCSAATTETTAAARWWRKVYILGYLVRLSAAAIAYIVWMFLFIFCCHCRHMLPLLLSSFDLFCYYVSVQFYSQAVSSSSSVFCLKESDEDVDGDERAREREKNCSLNLTLNIWNSRLNDLPWTWSTRIKYTAY